MVRYLTFKKLNISEERCLLELPQCLVSETDIAIVPKSSFSDIPTQKKILILAKNGELFSDFGVRKICSDITIAGFLYNSFNKKMLKNDEYFKTRDALNDMVLISDEVSYAWRTGFDIFNELSDEEKLLKNKCLSLPSNRSRYADNEPYEKFSIKIKTLLNIYKSLIDSLLKKTLSDKVFIENFRYIYKSNKIYSLYPYFGFLPSLKTVIDFYKSDIDKDVTNVSYNAKEMFKFIDGYCNDNYILLLKKWLGKNINLLRMDLITSICNALDNFYENALYCCKEYDNFDILFQLFNYLISRLNIAIITQFKRKSCVLYYADLKYRLVSDNKIKEKFHKIYNCFSNEVNKNIIQGDKCIGKKEVLKEYFFNEDNLLGKYQEQQNEYKLMSRILLDVSYDWIRDISSKKFDYQDKCSVVKSAETFYVYSEKYGNGILQIQYFTRRHHYICDFIEDSIYKAAKINNVPTIKKNNIQNLINSYLKNLDNIFFNYTSNVIYSIKSKRVLIYYDKFYIYFVVHDNIVLRLYYNLIFPNIDIAVLVLVSAVFKLDSIKKGQ